MLGLASESGTKESQPSRPSSTLGGRRVLLVPLREPHLDVVARVLHERGLDAIGQRLEARVVAELEEHALNVLADRLLHAIVGDDDVDAIARRCPTPRRAACARARSGADQGACRRASTGSRARSRGSPAGAPGRSAPRAAAPPKILTISLRSIARLTACRASIWLNGLMLTLSAKYQSAGNGLTCVCDAKRPQQLGQAVGRHVVDDPVGLSPLDLRDLGLAAQAEALHDAIDVAVRLGRRRPDLEVRVAPQHELPGRRVRGPGVGARADQPRDVACRSPRSPRSAAAARRAAARASASHSVSGRVRWNVIVRPLTRDAALERAGRRILQAGRRAVDHAVERLGRRAVHLEQALEREAHVGRAARARRSSSGRRAAT